MILNLLMTMVVSTVVVAFFRQMDKKNRSFDKVARLYKQIKSEFSQFADEKYRALRDFDDCIDVSLKKGDSMISEIKRCIDEIENRYNQVADEKERVGDYFTRLDELGNSIDKISCNVSEIQKSEEFLTNVDERLVGFRKELAVVERDLNRIEDNFKKENSVAIKDVANKVLKDMEDEYTKIKNHASILNDDITNRCKSVLNEIDQKENSINENFSILTSQYQDIQKNVDTTIQNFVSNVDFAVEEISSKNQDRIEKYAKSFKNLEIKMVDLLNNEKNKSIEQITNETNLAINSILEKISAIGTDTEGKIRRSFDEKNIDAEKVFSQLKLIEERINLQILTADGLNDKIDGKLSDFETLVNEVIDRKIEGFESSIKNISDDISQMESDIFKTLKDKYSSFENRIDEEINSVNSIIDNKIEMNLQTADKLGYEVSDLRLIVERMESELKNRTLEINELANSYKDESVNKIASAKMAVQDELSELRNLYDNEKSELLDKIQISFSSTGIEADKKLNDIRMKVESVYDSFSEKLMSLENDLGDRSALIEEGFDRKLSDLENGLKDREQYINSVVKERLDKYFEEATRINDEFKSNVTLSTSRIDEICSKFNQKVESVYDELENNISNCNIKALSAEEIYNSKLKELEDEFKKMNNDIIRENSIKLCAFEDQFSSIENRIQNYETIITDELSSKGDVIEKRISGLLSAFDDAEKSINLRLESQESSIANQTDQLVNLYRGELSSIKENLLKSTACYEEKFTEKCSEVDRALIDRMKDVNELVDRIKEMSARYSDRLSEFDVKAEDMVGTINDRLDNIEDSYRTKSEELFCDSKIFMESIEKKYDALNTKIEAINQGFATDIEGRILQAKSEIDRVVNNETGKVSVDIERFSEEVCKKFDEYKDDIISAKNAYDEFERSIAVRFDTFINEKNSTAEVAVKEFIDEKNSSIEMIKGNIAELDIEFKNRMNELENYYKEKVGSAVDEKIKFIMNAEDRMKRLDEALYDNEKRIETDVDEKIEQSRLLIDAFFESSKDNMMSKYMELESKTAASIDGYKNDLIRIKQNIKVIDDKFGAKFIKKLESVDEQLNEKLKSITDEFGVVLSGINTKIEEYDNGYVEKLGLIEQDFKNKNSEIIEKNRIELSDYTGKIEALMNEINNVRSFLNSEFMKEIESGKDEIRAFFDTERGVVIEGYKDIEASLHNVMDTYKSQLTKIKDGIKLIDEKLNVKIAEKLNEADTTLNIKYAEMNDRYNENIKALNDKVLSIEERFVDKIDSLEEKYTERGENFIIEGYSKFNEIQNLIDNLTVDFNNLKSTIDTDVEEKIENGKSKIDIYLAEGQDQILQYNDVIKSRVKEELDTYVADVDRLRTDIDNLDEKLNVGVFEKIASIDGVIDAKFEELHRSYIERIDSLKSNMSDIETDFAERVTIMEADFGSKGDAVYKDNIERFNSLSSKFKEIEEAISQMKNTVEKEISGKIEATLNNSYQIINQKGNEIAAIYTSKANEYEEKLALLDDTVSEKIRNTASLFNAGSDEIKVKLLSLEKSVMDDIEQFNADLKCKTDSELKLGMDEIKSLRDGYDKLQNGLSTALSDLDNYKNQMVGNGEKIAGEFELMFNELFEATKSKTEGVSKEAAKGLHELSMRFTLLNDEMSGFRNRIDNEITEQLDTGLKNINTIMEEKSSSIKAAFNTIEEEIVSKNAIYRDKLDVLNSKINNFEKIFIDSLNEKIGNSDSFVTEKINELSNSVAGIEASYKEKINGLNEKFAHFSESLENDNVRNIETLTALYDSLGSQIESVNKTLEKDISDRIRDGIEQVEQVVSDRVLELENNENEIACKIMDKVKEYSVFIDDLKERASEIEDSYKTSVKNGVAYTDSVVASSLANLKERIESAEFAHSKRLDSLTSSMAEDSKKYIDGVNEYIVGLQKNCQNINDTVVDLKNRIEAEIEEKINQATTIEIDRMKNEIACVKNSIIEDYTGTISGCKVELSDTIVGLKKTFGDSLSGMGNEYEQKIKEITSDYSVFTDELKNVYQEKLDSYDSGVKDKLSVIEKRVEEQIESAEKSFKDGVSSVYEEYNKNFGDMKSMLDETINEMSVRLNNIHDELTAKNVKIDSEYSDKYKKIEKDYRMICADIDAIKVKLESDIKNTIDYSLMNIETIFTQKSDSVTDSFRQIEGEMVERINNYRSELHKVQQSLSGVEVKYGDLFNKKMNDFDSKLSGKFVEVRSVIDDNLGLLNEKIKDIAADYDAKFINIEDEYNSKAESMLMKNAKKLDDFEERYNLINREILSLQKTVNDEVLLTIETGKHEIGEVLDGKIVEAKTDFENVSGEVKRGIADFKGDFIKLQNSMKQIDERFTAKFIEHSNVLDKRVSVIETEVSKFEKNLSLLEKTSSMKDKLNEEIKEIKEKIDEIRVDKSELQKIEKNIGNIEKIAKMSEEKYSKLFNDARKLDNINEVLVELQNMTTSVDDKIEEIKRSKALISNVEDGINSVKERAVDIERLIAELERKGEIIKDSMESIESVRDEASGLRGMISELNRGYDELEFKRDTYEKSIKSFEKDAVLITKSQGKINDVMNKFKEMDSLVEDIETRTSSIIKLREWLVKAETQIENLNFETDKRIKLLESLGNTPVESTSTDKKPKEDSKRKMVLQLKSQGWAIDDIAKTANLSIGEVEFILDLEMSNRKK